MTQLIGAAILRIRRTLDITPRHHLPDDLVHPLRRHPQPPRQLILVQRLGGESPEHITVGGPQILIPARCQIGTQRVRERLIRQPEHDTKVDVDVPCHLVSLSL